MQILEHNMKQPAIFIPLKLSFIQQFEKKNPTLQCNLHSSIKKLCVNLINCTCVTNILKVALFPLKKKIITIYLVIGAKKVKWNEYGV